MTPETKPCPNPACGRPGTLIRDRLGSTGTSYRRECACGTAGPWARSHDEADALWNGLPRSSAGLARAVELAEAITVPSYADPDVLRAAQSQHEAMMTVLRRLLDLCGPDSVDDALAAAARAARGAALPEGFLWGSDAVEGFRFGRAMAAEAVDGVRRDAAEGRIGGN